MRYFLSPTFLIVVALSVITSYLVFVECQYSNVVYYGNDYAEKQQPKKLSETQQIQSAVSDIVSRFTANLPQKEDSEDVAKIIKAAEG